MKTAVIIFHGIGEQRPMDTLRGFVEAVVGVTEGRQNYFSKPDKLSETLELRCLQAKGRGGAHFYEYYWAHLAEGTRLRAVIWWIIGLACRSGRNVPSSAKSLWYLTRLMLLTLLALIVSGVVGRLNQWFGAKAEFGIVWFSVLGILLLAQYSLVFFLGDAARYLSPLPSNIELRQRIRRQGLELMRTLHAREEYDRIVVVGHSLGSVIGYDIITHLWQEYSESVPALDDPAKQEIIRSCLKAKVHIQPFVRTELAAAGGKLGSEASPETVDQFRAAQSQTLREQRRLGNPWRVTDFITLGSPLAHGMLLQARGRDDFEMRKLQRELPTCPPQMDEKGYAYGASEPFAVGEGLKFTPLYLHDAAAFGVTRWTNLFFPAHLGLFGDFVGGPLAPAFGYGIKDIPVCTRSCYGLLDYTLMAHLRYWSPDSAVANETANRRHGAQSALQQLRKALDLSNRSFKAAPWPLTHVKSAGASPTTI
jgi:hypothetical protein